MNKHEIGSYHEKRACAYLSLRGIKVIETNFRRKCGEIDIIAKDGEYLAFIEVKFRSSSSFGGAQYAVGRVKQKRVRETAAAYLHEKGTCGCRFFRFDAVLITGENVEYIKDAWQ